ncbi:putative short-chain dehydrogenase/reductase family protein [Microdochium bolleyi]|uniref:Putative short-chain dehydrogenase/reductase family protein n=1 Tax=Microdochium bolleyi TaxID=196109 RepID=A0A136JJH6_9PEZI|nr:putative short-chain dehydrogenase/reductase family protein [Microdochium bolleyi]
MHIPLNPLEALRIIAGQFLRLPYPTHSFSGQTIIVTGANTGLGLEAARHFVRLGAARVILGVRDPAKGAAAATSIAQSTGRPGVAQVWQLDLARRASVEAFAARAGAELDRLDVVVENAGVLTKNFSMTEDGNESTVTVNVINTLYLGILLLPKLRESSARHGGREGVLTFVGSFVHFITWFPERKYAPSIFEGMADRARARMGDRYYVSKMMELLLVRELAAQVTAREQQEGVAKVGKVTVSCLNPGWVVTDLQREGMPFLMSLGRRWVARDTELGSRTLVHAAQGGEETHGQYLSDCRVDQASGWVRGSEGQATQKRLWGELMELLERTNPDVKQCI